MGPLTRAWVGGAIILTVAAGIFFAPSVSDSGPASAEDAQAYVAAESLPPELTKPARKVRIIEMSAENADRSDHTKWYSRTRKPPPQKQMAKTDVSGTGAARAVEKRSQKTVRRAPPATRDAYSAYASESTMRRGGFGLFHW